MIAPYYDQLYPLPRDRARLRQSFEHDGYKPEYPVTVRPLDGRAETFEIICGVGRYIVAGEYGMRRIPAIVREMDEREARRYAIQDNLYSPTTVTDISLVHAIFLARVFTVGGLKYPSQFLWELAKASESTFWRAVKCLDFALARVLEGHRELTDLEPSDQVARIVKNNLFPDFTELWKGTLEVNTFYQRHALEQGQVESKQGPKMRQSARAQRLSPSDQRQNIELMEEVAAASCPEQSAAVLKEGTDLLPQGQSSRPRKKDQVDNNLSLFDRYE